LFWIVILGLREEHIGIVVMMKLTHEANKVVVTCMYRNIICMTFIVCIRT